MIWFLILLHLNSCLSLQPYVQNSPYNQKPHHLRNVAQTPRKFLNTAEELQLTKVVKIDAQPCNGQHSVSVFIPSAGRSTGKYFDSRQTLRSLWVNELKDLNVSVYFVVAMNRNDTINEELEKEAKTYQDLIQFGFIDAYYNLTLKTIAILRWVNKKCLNSSYILKTDDDVIVNTQMLLKKLTQFKNGISGNLGQNLAPYREETSNEILKK